MGQRPHDRRVRQLQLTRPGGGALTGPGALTRPGGGALTGPGGGAPPGTVRGVRAVRGVRGVRAVRGVGAVRATSATWAGQAVGRARAPFPELMFRNVTLERIISTTVMETFLPTKVPAVRDPLRATM